MDNNRNIPNIKLPTRAVLALAVGLMLLPLGAVAQEKEAEEGDFSIDLFCGAELGLVDFNYFQQYNTLLDFTPGIKATWGSHWQVAAQGKVIVYNTLNADLKRAYLNMLVVSKEWRWGTLCLKGSGGLFSNARYGVDVKAFWPVSRWLALEAQGGCTGLMSMAEGWQMSPWGRWAGTVGGDIYLSRTHTQLRGVVGRYVYTDWGAEAEAMRHFRHTTVGLYAKWSNRAMKGNDLLSGIDGGFKVTVMVPPYSRTCRRVNFRPVSNFSFGYLVRGMDRYRNANRMYKTDPEENMREGWFCRDLLQWGSHTMEPDFTYNEKEERE